MNLNLYLYNDNLFLSGLLQRWKREWPNVYWIPFVFCKWLNTSLSVVAVHPLIVIGDSLADLPVRLTGTTSWIFVFPVASPNLGHRAWFCFCNEWCVLSTVNRFSTLILLSYEVSTVSSILPQGKAQRTLVACLRSRRLQSTHWKPCLWWVHLCHVLLLTISLLCWGNAMEHFANCEMFKGKIIFVILIMEV